MYPLLNPRILFFVQTLPALILSWLCLSNYHVIKTMLSVESQQLWLNFALTLLFLSAVTIAYAAFAWKRNEKISLWYGVTALIVWSVYLYQYLLNSTDLLPWSIPNWMVSENAFFYPLTFLMPAAAHALFVCAASTIGENEKPWYSVLGALILPALMYLVTQFGRNFDSIYFVGILFLIATVSFMFFLVRITVQIMQKKIQFGTEQSIGWKIIISIILPLVGLYLNRGIFMGPSMNTSASSAGIFGAFHTPWIYGLTVANGLILSFLPPNLNEKSRLFWFLLRCVGFTYTVYFFFVFLPWLPFSMIAIIAIGSGILMLVPIVLFVVHLMELQNDFYALRSFFKPYVLRGVAIGGFFTIPVLITLEYYQDKRTLQQALEYLFVPDYHMPAEKVNVESLRKTIASVERLREGRRTGTFGLGANNDLPYLSSWFQYIVLDNQTLSNSRVRLLKRVYFAPKEETIATNQPNTARVPNPIIENTDISSISVNTEFDSTQQAWLTWIDLEITNPNAEQTEFGTQFTLDPGCFLTDYYLYVNGKKEMGQLVEKKSALWVFSQIKQIRRDPGILYFKQGNQIAFQVYPFLPNEVRKTGFQILHKAPFSLQMGEHNIKVKTPTHAPAEAILSNQIAYLTAEAKAALPLKQRKPYLHFIVDATTDSLALFANRMETVIAQNPKWLDQARLSIVGTYTQTELLDPSRLRASLTEANERPEEGFYLDRAIRQSLVEAFEAQTDAYPVFVVVTDHFDQAIIEVNFDDLVFAYPDLPVFAIAQADGSLEQHSLEGNPQLALEEHAVDTLPSNLQSLAHPYQIPVRVFTWPDGSVTHLSANEGPVYALKKDAKPSKQLEIKEKHWPTALSLQAHHYAQTLHPESGDAAWLELVRSSFAARIMMPVTSFLVVETDAQRAALKRKQSEMLNSHKYFDATEADPEELSEPHLYITALLLLVFIWWRQRRGLV
jgi:hypothetical protein